MTAVGVLLVEDHVLFRQGLRRLLETESQFRVVSEAGSVAGAVSAACEYMPDVILMDLKLGQESGLDATRAILGVQPDARILALTAFDDFPMIEAAAAAGVLGYVLKGVSLAELTEAILTVRLGRRYIHPALGQSLLLGIGHQARQRASALTASELQLLRLMADGAGFPEMAAATFVSERTVRRHVQALLDKLEVTDRTQAVAKAIRQGWL